MAYYAYEGRDRTGKKRQGQVTASSRSEAIVSLKERGVAVINIKEVKVSFWQQEITIGSPVRLKDFVIFNRQFATLLRAGVTVVEATKILAAQTESKALKGALISIEEELRSGNPLSQATKQHPKIFPPVFNNMVQAGETAGNLDETLDRLATHFEKQHHTKQKVISALSYPAIVSVIAVVVVIFLLANVVPTFAAMFASIGSELPWITQFVLAISDWMKVYWWLVIVMFVALYMVFYFLRQKPSTKYYVDYAILKLPIFGRLFQKAAIARMTRTLSSLFSSSVPILSALAIVEKVAENEVISRVMHDAAQSLKNGKPLTEPMSKHWVFPPMVTQMIAIGEQTGALDDMLSKIADFYEMEVENTTDQLKSLIEPLMIVVLAVIVGTIVISIIVPMFGMFSEIGNM